MYETPEIGTMPEDKDINVVVERLSDEIQDTFVWRTADYEYQSCGFTSLEKASQDADANGFIYREPGTYGENDRYIVPESILGLDQ